MGMRFSTTLLLAAAAAILILGCSDGGTGVGGDEEGVGENGEDTGIPTGDGDTEIAEETETDGDTTPSDGDTEEDTEGAGMSVPDAYWAAALALNEPASPFGPDDVVGTFNNRLVNRISTSQVIFMVRPSEITEVEMAALVNGDPVDFSVDVGPGIKLSGTSGANAVYQFDPDGLSSTVSIGPGDAPPQFTTSQPATYIDVFLTPYESFSPDDDGQNFLRVYQAVLAGKIGADGRSMSEATLSGCATADLIGGGGLGDFKLYFKEDLSAVYLADGMTADNPPRITCFDENGAELDGIAVSFGFSAIAVTLDVPAER